MHSHSEKHIAWSFIGSIVFHGLLFFLYLNFVLLKPDTGNIVLTNVDLLVQEKEERAPKPANKTLDFLKLALPKMPKIEMAQAPRMPSIEIKTPEARRKNFELPQKLLERSGRVQNQEKLEMDTEKRAVSAVNADLGIKAERSAMALAPRIELEEVGLKKAPSIPANLKFDENARAQTPQTMRELNIAVERAQKVSAQPQGLAENTGTIAAAGRNRVNVAMPTKLAEVSDQKVDLSAGLRKQPVLTAAAFKPARDEGIRNEEAPRKVEIEGPLSKRKVVKYYVPSFPGWAVNRGILEATVAVKFYVDNSGRVQDNATVERTSGYGEFDRLALEAIKQWRFEPLTGTMTRQWGIITFRFVTE